MIDPNMAKSAKPPRRTFRAGVLVFDQCSAWVAAAIREALELAVVLDPDRRDPPLLAVRWIGVDRARLAATAQMRFEHVQHDVRGLDVLIVPPLWHASLDDFARRLDRLDDEVALLRKAHRAGVDLASICSGVALLARAGVLDGRVATGCWWLEPTLRKLYPQVRWHLSDSFVRDGPVLTAGSGSAYTRLAFHLLEHVGGRGICARVSQFLGIEPNRDRQSPFAHLVPARRNDDPLVAAFLRHVHAKAGSMQLSVESAARALHTSSRTLFRRVRDATGEPPHRLLQLTRLEQAKSLLADTALSIDEICERCGWQDTTSFRKLFRREVGLTAAAWRKAFGLRRAAAPTR